MKTSAVKGGNFDPAMIKALSDAIQPETRYALRDGDLLMIRGNGSPELVGGAAYVASVPDRCMLPDLLYRLAYMPEKADGKYLSYALGSRALRHQIELAARGIDILKIAQPSIAELRVALPPRQEQVAIVSVLDAEVYQLDALTKEAECAIDLLTERRSALISAAVTGKIDVRWRAAQTDTGKARLAIGAALIYRLSHKPTFGRVKLQKLLYLAEAYADMNKLGGDYLREAAGPLDRELLADVERLLKHDADVDISQLDGRGGAVRYKVRDGKGLKIPNLDDVLGDSKSKFDHLVDSMADLDTKGSEAVATLFAVWNDALIDQETTTDDSIVSGFLTKWHPEKSQKFKAPELHTWLGWMRRHNIVPTGRGPRTSKERLLL